MGIGLARQPARVRVTPSCQALEVGQLLGLSSVEPNALSNGPPVQFTVASRVDLLPLLDVGGLHELEPHLGLLQLLLSTGGESMTSPDELQVALDVLEDSEDPKLLVWALTIVELGTKPLKVHKPVTSLSSSFRRMRAVSWSASGGSEGYRLSKYSMSGSASRGRSSSQFEFRFIHPSSESELGYSHSRSRNVRRILAGTT